MKFICPSYMIMSVPLLHTKKSDLNLQVKLKKVIIEPKRKTGFGFNYLTRIKKRLDIQSYPSVFIYLFFFS